MTEQTKKDIHNYEDIINIPRPEPRRYTRMSVTARAAQFMPFAALTGYTSVIDEVSRTTEHKIQLDESEINRINKKLRYLKHNMKKGILVAIRHFRADEKKEGGKYILSEGLIKQIDEYSRSLTMSDSTVIAFDDILSILIKTNNREI